MSLQGIQRNKLSAHPTETNSTDTAQINDFQQTFSTVRDGSEREESGCPTERFRHRPEEAKPGEYTTYTSNDTRFEEIREGFFDDRSTVERAKADLGRENIGRWFVHKHVWKLFIDAPLPAIT